MSEKHMIVPSALSGIRLDRALAELLPETGLRHRRRLCEEGRVTVNARRAKPSLKLMEGMEVRVSEDSCEPARPEDLGVYVLGAEDGFAAVYKPEGVHSAVIDGRTNCSVEAMLPALFPEYAPVLLNRLDNPTSGILLVALNAGAAQRYQHIEDRGGIRKEYLAEVSGSVVAPVTIRRALDVADRRVVRVLDEDSSDPLRQTAVEPIRHEASSASTLVCCRIAKGARHQIRVHLASIGHPILGDTLYAGPEAERLHLHHYRLEIGQAVFQAPCPFAEEDSAQP